MGVFQAKNSDFGPKIRFCYCTPDFVNGLFVALGKTVHFQPSDRFFKAGQNAKETQFDSTYPGKQPVTNKLGLNCGISVQGQQAMEKVQTFWLKRSSLKDLNILIRTLPQMGAREWGDELCSEVFHLFCDIINGHIFLQILKKYPRADFIHEFSSHDLQNTLDQDCPKRCLPVSICT